MRTGLVEELRNGYDNEPSSLPREAERMASVMAEAANELEQFQIYTDKIHDIRGMSVWEKVHAVSAEVGVVQMTLNVDTGKSTYKAISINDVVDSLLPLLTKYRLIVVPLQKEIIEQAQITTTTKYGDKQQFYVRVKASYMVVNIDKPNESIMSVGYGDGIDSGDKATGKANTYARKYALIDLFNLSKGDDPDKEASQEYKPIEKSTKEQIAKINSLYSEKEINTMLKRMKKADLYNINWEEAEKMIAKRDRSLVNDQTETF